MIRRILAGLGGTTFAAVTIQRAVTNAQAQDAELTGVTVFDTQRFRCEGVGLVKAPNREQIRAERMHIARSQVQDSVSRFESACKAANIRYRLVEETGGPFTRLVDQSQYHELMIFGLRSVFEYDFLAGDPESILIRLVSAGVRPLIAVSNEYRTIARVLIAYSGSMESAKAMKRFVQMRLWPKAELKIVTFHPSEDKAFELLREAEVYCRAWFQRMPSIQSGRSQSTPARRSENVAGRHDRDGKKWSQCAAEKTVGGYVTRNTAGHAHSMFLAQ